MARKTDDSKEKRAQKVIDDPQFSEEQSHYAFCYWNFIMGRRAEKPSIDAIGYDAALAIRVRLVTIES